ncbi:GTP-binding protein [Pirellulaceae bacterium]|nr:GTP-binding protein [Pirellulaceae bacterium]
MAWEKGKRVPTNMIVGFLGSGKTTAITKLIEKRPEIENWSILINEFGTVSIDHAIVDTSLDGVAVEELGGGCACCTLAFAFKPLLAKFLRRTKPDRFILELSGLSHPAKVVDILRSENFSGSIELRNIICLIDPNDLDDPRWRESEVFHDQVQLADIVILNWTDSRPRELIDRCRDWIAKFRPPKRLIVETCYGDIDPKLLDVEFDDVRFPLFGQAHLLPDVNSTELREKDLNSERPSQMKENFTDLLSIEPATPKAVPRRPLRYQNNDHHHDARGWIFHRDDVFVRDKLLDFFRDVQRIVRLKGIFRCENDWWLINQAKNGASFATSTYRRDSRLELIIDQTAFEWGEFENQLLVCLANR